MSEGSVQEATMAANSDDIVQLNSNGKPSLDAASVFPFAKLPKDIRRMIYDILPEPVFRPLLRSGLGLGIYFEILRMPHGLVQANKFFREEMTACLDPLIVNQPIVIFLYIEPGLSNQRLLFDSVLQAVLGLIHNGRLYDDRNNSRGEGISRASFDTWTLRAPMLHFKRAMVHKLEGEPVSAILIEDAVVNIFLRHTLAKLRRRPESIVNIRAMASHIQINGRFAIYQSRAVIKDRYGLNANYTMIILQESSRLENVSSGCEPKEIEQRLLCKSERLLLDQIHHN